MAKLKNLRNEEFCQIYATSRMRGNATRCYMWVYSQASYKTAMTNGPRLRKKCYHRIIEIQEELRKAMGGYGSVDYRRERRNKSKLASSQEHSKADPPPSPTVSAKPPAFPKPYEIPKHLRDTEDYPERGSWDSVL